MPRTPPPVPSSSGRSSSQDINDIVYPVLVEELTVPVVRENQRALENWAVLLENLKDFFWEEGFQSVALFLAESRIPRIAG